MTVGRKMLCVCCDGGGCAQPHATGEHKQEWDNTKVEIDQHRAKVGRHMNASK